ncbi:MAG: sulfatase-like hydrolase/transferase [Planctomycetes bacterium]|nr:sulfatase-like hydrolase/transferase [Planctomycetota bacterium]
MHSDSPNPALRFLRLALGLGLTLTAALSIAPLAEAQGGPTPPNVLVVCVDDLGIESVQRYGIGTDCPTTPTIDGLAAQGVTFRNAYSYVLCSPSRACILTGRYAIRHGIGWLVDGNAPLPLSEFTIPEMLDTAPAVRRYAHASIGKWHLGHDAQAGGALAPNLAGFSHFAGTLRNVLAPETYYSYTRVVNGVAAPSTNYMTSEEVDDALAWIQQQTGAWFCALNFQSGHEPYHTPPQGTFTTDLANAGSSQANPRAYYKAMIESVDFELGRLLNALGPARAQTMVFLVSDNGTPPRALPPPYDPRRGKSTLYEAGTRVPMIVSGPLVQQPGTFCEALVDLTDIFPTVAELAGIALPAALPVGRKLDGLSLMPYLADPATPSLKNVVLSERYFPNGRAYGQPISGGGQVGPICQPDLGFAGPGATRLDFCAPGILARGVIATLTIHSAPPQAPGLLFVSAGLSPLPILGGTLAGGLNGVYLPFVCDANGVFSLGGWGTGPTFEEYPFGTSLFLQAIVVDLGLPELFAFTNTVRADFLNENRKAIRNERYKLIDSVHGGELVGGPDELYDLQLDPLELNDLRRGPLSTEQQAAYLYLKAQLGAVMADALTGN